MPDDKPKGWGANPSRSIEGGKFVIGCGKDKARAETIAAAMSEKEWDWSGKLKFFVAQDPYKQEWSVFLGSGYSSRDWEPIRAAARGLKQASGGRRGPVAEASVKTTIGELKQVIKEAVVKKLQ